ncbi:MAG: acetyl-CoA carboxylase carboxyltransferase subunit alpha [Firmicutes bacterium]|nr:acetyl-CoA carboxylase carboxyltransferase subunit alpha [Bacillota bacterium]
MRNGLFEWEKPLYELELRIEELQKFTAEKDIDLSREIATLEKRAEYLRREIYESLSAWQQVLLARHPKRPTTLDYIELIFDDFYEFHGDRNYRDDPAIVGGLAVFDGLPVTVIGPQKGRDTKENIRRNFGLPHPEGYRKALRLMEQAEKFRRPIISLIDVVGAYPGVEAEERGQGIAIAQSIRQMSFLEVPIVCVITGEGGSGGALAIGIGDRILMLEHGWYSVISPEMCAQILWKDSSKAPEAAEALKLTATDLIGMDAIDGIVPEPLGGAHKNHQEAAANLKVSLKEALKEILSIPVDVLVKQRLERFRQLGEWQEKAVVVSEIK